MTDKLVEERIREYYVANTGEWLAEKGKVKEARLLKEACETIERLRRQNTAADNNYYRLLKTTSEKERELEAREKEIEKRETRFEERKASFIRDFENWV